MRTRREIALGGLLTIVWSAHDCAHAQIDPKTRMPISCMLMPSVKCMSRRASAASTSAVARA